MSSETVQAATQPEAQPQIVVEKKGAQTSESDFARRIAGKQVANPFVNTVAEAPKEEAKAPAPKPQETQEVPAAEETKPEAEVEANAETEAADEETEEVPSHENNTLDPKLQKILDKRIGKEVGKRKRLEAENAELRARVAQTPTEVEKEVPVPVPANVPLAEITTLEQLNSYRDGLQSDIIEAEGLLWSEFPPEGLNTKWGRTTKAGLIAAITQAKKDMAMSIPARERFLITRSQVQLKAHEDFPFLADPTHPGFKLAQQARKDNPVLANYPNREYLIGQIVEGQLARSEREATKAKPAKAKPKPTSGQAEVASDASLGRAPVGVMKEQALATEIAGIVGTKKGLDAKDFGRLLAAKQRYRNSQ